MPPQPLDGTAKYVESGVGQYNYYINVVPTVYTKLNGDVSERVRCAPARRARAR
jgi:hypothetical protein